MFNLLLTDEITAWRFITTRRLFLLFLSSIWGKLNRYRRLTTSLKKNEFDLLTQVCNFTIRTTSVCVSNRIKKHSKKQLSTPDAFVQLLRASWVIFIEDGVREQPTRLPRKNLTRKCTHHYTCNKRTLLFECWAMGQGFTCMSLCMKPLR